jgi:hypothetical protein
MRSLIIILGSFFLLAAPTTALAKKWDDYYSVGKWTASQSKKSTTTTFGIGKQTKDQLDILRKSHDLAQSLRLAKRMPIVRKLLAQGRFLPLTVESSSSPSMIGSSSGGQGQELRTLWLRGDRRGRRVDLVVFKASKAGYRGDLPTRLEKIPLDYKGTRASGTAVAQVFPDLRPDQVASAIASLVSGQSKAQRRPILPAEIVP